MVVKLTWMSIFIIIFTAQKEVPVTIKDLLETAEPDKLYQESTAFLANHGKYLTQTVSKLKNGMPIVDDFLSNFIPTQGSIFLFGVQWAFTMVDNLQTKLGERNWLERTILKRNRQFYQSQATLAATDIEREEFSQRATQLVDGNFPLKSQILLVASSMDDYNQVRAFRAGALLGIEILLRIEDERSSVVIANELQQSFQ